MKRSSLIFFILFFTAPFAGAQVKSGVKLLAKAKGKVILLRWAPTTSFAWSQGNQKGYWIERYSITRNKEILGKPEKVFLTNSTIKPRPLKEWEADAQSNDHSAIAAQAIYGSSFQASLSQASTLTEVANRSKELEQRFSFALLSADHSFQTAKLSALGFEDTTAKKDERYLYRVYVANKDVKIKLDTGIFYLGLQDSVGLTPPMNVSAQFADKIVLLKWPKSFVERQYTSYIIERSDGGNFIRRNTLPYINTTSESNTELFFQALDSLPQNEVEYQYRIRGITPFGEIGPESERVSGKGFETLDAKASITQAKEENGKVQLQWRVLGNANAVGGFYVERASNTNEPFIKLNEQKLNQESTSYIDQSPLSSNYYRIKVVGGHRQSSTSFPFFVQLTDSMPPAQPQGLLVKIDTAGVAKLSWTSNHEKDLFGYAVYRSNFLNSEFSRINSSALRTSFYSDSLNIKTLSTKVYYKLAAFDKRMNRSAYSKIVEVELPDIIPPMPPAIKKIRPDSTGIFLAWNKSSSEDVTSYQLQRKTADSSQWKIIRAFTKNDEAFYLDLKLNHKTEYQYRLIAIDKGGLKSTPSKVVSGKAMDNILKPAISNLIAKADRDARSILLQWKYKEAGVSKYLVYRAVENEPLTLYKTISGNSQNFIDMNATMNTKYVYVMKVVFSDGRESGYSLKTEIKY